MMLGVRIDNLSHDEIESWIKNVLNNPPRQKFITTLNPEIILKGFYDDKYRDILNSADLNLCDGFGIKFVSWLKGAQIKKRYTGVDLTNYLLELAKKNSKKVLIVISEDSLSSPEETKKGIEKKYGVAPQAEYFEENFFNREEVKNAQIVFVNFGAPKQEKFIFHHREKFPEAQIMAGVGGTFDFMTGKMKRAPKIFRSLGLEWLWRLLQEPKRLERIVNAVIIFPYLALKNRSNAE